MVKEISKDPYIRLAKEALKAYVANNQQIHIPDWVPDEMREQRAGVFVTFKEEGLLRGCIGTIAPTQPSLAEEVIHNAIQSGTSDPRFPPVKENELERLSVSVDVLGEPESVRNMNELDPKKYGVIVSRGWMRGLLLPDLEGVETVEEQLDIALRKAGIGPGKTYDVERFEVIRHKE